MAGPWYVLTDKGCWKRFDASPSESSPWTWTGPTGTGNYMTAYPGDLWFDLNPWTRQMGDPPPGDVCGYSQVGNVSFPRLSKPSWLVSFLASCNWQVFTWYINPGDWIEDAIDWVCDKINDLLATGEDIGGKALAAWESLQGLWGDIEDFVDSAISSATRGLENIRDEFDGLVDEVQDWVGSYIDDVREWVMHQVSAFDDAIDNLRSRWDSFWRDTFPDLVDRFTLDDIIVAALAPVFEAINQLTDLTDSLRELIDDPEKWLLDRLEAMLARFI